MGQGAAPLRAHGDRLTDAAYMGQVIQKRRIMFNGLIGQSHGKGAGRHTLITKIAIWCGTKIFRWGQTSWWILIGLHNLEDLPYDRVERVAGIGQGEGDNLQLLLEMPQQRIVAVEGFQTVPFAFVGLKLDKKLIVELDTLL